MSLGLSAMSPAYKTRRQDLEGLTPDALKRLMLHFDELLALTPTDEDARARLAAAEAYYCELLQASPLTPTKATKDERRNDTPKAA